MLILGVAAAALSPPPPIELRALFSADDLPQEYLPPESDRTVGVRVTVRPDGRIQDCEAEYTSGIEGLDVFTCKLIKRRAKYAPAPAQNGTPSYAVYRTSVRWVVTSFARPGPPPSVADLTLTVNQLPAGLKSPAYVNVKFDVDERGVASSCSAEGALRRNNSDDLQLVQVACGEVLKSYKPKPAKNEQGTPVPSVQDALVAFAIK